MLHKTLPNKKFKSSFVWLEFPFNSYLPNMANYSNDSMILHWRDEEGTERIKRTRFIHFNIYVDFVAAESKGIFTKMQSFQNMNMY